MKSSIPNERQSAPTGAQTSELEQEAERPLGVASCCASFSMFTVLGPKLTRKYQPNGNVCDRMCPSHSRQQAELMQSGNSQLTRLLHDALDSPDDLRQESQRCRHNPDASQMLALASQWREQGCPPPIEWLCKRRWDVDPSVMYYLGLPFVEGVVYVAYDGWDFGLPSIIPAQRQEHAPSPAGASVEAPTASEPTEHPENSAAGDGCCVSPCCASSDPFWGKLRAFTDFMKERQAFRKSEPSFQPTKEYIREGMLVMASGLRIISQGVQRLEPCESGQIDRPSQVPQGG